MALGEWDVGVYLCLGPCALDFTWERVCALCGIPSTASAVVWIVDQFLDYVAWQVSRGLGALFVYF
jgi:hypothetical protein